MLSLWVNKQCVCRLVTQSLSCPSVRLRCCWADFFFIFKVRNNSKDLIVSFLLKRKYANLLAETWLVQEYNWNDLKLKNNNKITLNFSILIIKTKYLWVCSWRRRKCLIWERSCWFKAGMRAGAERQSAAPIRWESQVFFFLSNWLWLVGGVSAAADVHCRPSQLKHFQGRLLLLAVFFSFSPPLLLVVVGEGDRVIEREWECFSLCRW